MCIMENFKFYQGITEENMRKAYDELKKEGHSVTDFFPDFVDDKFILFYNKADITRPPLADLEKSRQDNPTFNYVDPQRPMQNMAMEYLREYWYIVGFIAFGLFYYLFVYK